VEKLPVTACRTCGIPLPRTSSGKGRARRYCGPRCRRRKEYARRTWDRLQGWIRAADLNAAWEGFTPRQREAHRRHGDTLRRLAGVRP